MENSFLEENIFQEQSQFATNQLFNPSISLLEARQTNRRRTLYLYQDSILSLSLFYLKIHEFLCSVLTVFEA